MKIFVLSIWVGALIPSLAIAEVENKEGETRRDEIFAQDGVVEISGTARQDIQNDIFGSSIETSYYLINGFHVGMTFSCSIFFTGANDYYLSVYPIAGYTYQLDENVFGDISVCCEL